jgi:hypothetical protein
MVTCVEIFFVILPPLFRLLSVGDFQAKIHVSRLLLVT